MLKARYHKLTLKFKFLARTSREAMNERETYFLHVWDDDNPGVEGIGECNLFRGLSAEDGPDYETRLQRMCENIDSADCIDAVSDCSSILFGLETAMADFRNGGKRRPFPGKWSKGETSIPINGLVWMGDKATMSQRIKEKLDAGFSCLKLKIGGIDFCQELELLNMVRSAFGEDELQIRLDANGAFAPGEALEKLSRLSEYGIHSIEQPIKAGQWEEMASLCRHSPIDIALDEELIGVSDDAKKERLLDAIKPQYIILKPALSGGFSHAGQWISKAREKGIGWWATSALESNVGLNAIAQWLDGELDTEDAEMRQGLGTGGLYCNNIASPLYLDGDHLRLDPNREWGDIP
ncbi:MAG: o-succinylbenzoate synthase [Clostridium sp.]|nr:o-succinylbenzoate synthase [Clostridium sp.]